MKNRIEYALKASAGGDNEALREVVAEIKQFPRTAEGLFDTTSVDSDYLEAAKWVYPVYAAFETECNKEECYPDLLAQIRNLDAKQKAAASLAVTAKFLNMLIATIDNVTPQLYEYYRELVDIFRADVKEVIFTYYKDGGFGAKGSAEDALVRGTIAHAGETHVLLAEKYQEFM